MQENHSRNSKENLVKVLLGSDTYPPDVNGASHFTERLAMGLLGRGHTVHVIAPSPTGRSFTEERHGAVVHRLRSHRYPLVDNFHICMPWEVAPTITRIVDDVAPDVVHVQNHFVTGRFLARTCNKRNVPLVATNHFMPENLVELAPIPRAVQDRVSQMAWRDVGRVFRRAGVVTAPTPRAVELLERSTKLQGATAISCGIDARPYRAAAQRAIHSDVPTILFVGRLDQEKRVNELIDAVAQLPGGVAYRLEIVGDGTCRARWQAQANERGLDGRVIFRGFVDDDQLLDAYGRCDIFVMPGVAELQSLVTLEAMAAGKPVLAADAMALPHLVRPDVNGYLYTPGDSAELSRHLARLLADPKLRERLGQASQRMVMSHSMDATLDAFEAIYARVSPASTR